MKFISIQKIHCGANQLRCKIKIIFIVETYNAETTTQWLFILGR